MDNNDQIGKQFKIGDSVLECVAMRGERMVLMPIKTPDMKYRGLYGLKCKTRQFISSNKNLLTPASVVCAALFVIFLAFAAFPAGSAVMYEPEVGPRPASMVYMPFAEELFTQIVNVNHLIAAVSDQEPAVWRRAGSDVVAEVLAELIDPEPEPEPETELIADAETPASAPAPVAGRSLGYFTIYAYCNCTVCCGSWSPYARSRMRYVEHETIDETTMEPIVTRTLERDPDYIHKTASGTTPTVGRTIATDWSILPRGTRVIINGQLYIAEDTGTGIVGSSIDLYFGDWKEGAHEAALEHGVRRVEVFAAANP